ncbi:Penicillin-insensitive transglycosylase / Penicillin-sensitive transpeptidase [Burkholderiales bacterium 8X]|nr:Penicillin-insensitive transglycosylase / Penicillin-sensitive transpeptidase [Burkholderiales bacterium 8X]
MTDDEKSSSSKQDPWGDGPIRPGGTPPERKARVRSNGAAAGSKPSRLRRIAVWGGAAAAGTVLALVLTAGIGYALISPNLPDISSVADYHPKLPLQVYSSDGVLIGEFGEERRTLVPLASIPLQMRNAVLAAEDARFYEHGGVDMLGLARALVANLDGGRAQGASTITMQVARNLFLSSERTLTRKAYEVLLAYRLEQRLSKDQILEIYLNQIYLGNRAYGFAAASETYFGKPLQQVTVAEAAMLAGLPKAPGTRNPIANLERAKERQRYVIDRMKEAGFIRADEVAAAKAESLKLKDAADPNRLHAEYVAETVRQLMLAQYGDSTYTRGLKVTTSLVADEQAAAYRALRKGILDYERRQVYRGPEAFIELPADARERDDAIDEVLSEHPDEPDMMSAVVLSASAREVEAVRADGEVFKISGAGLQAARSGLAAKAAPEIRVRPGAVIRVSKTPKDAWEITQQPEVEGALVALDPRDGTVKAMVGGFDFEKNKFNHVTQAWRQPGSSFKPFIYSAALEKGFAPATVVNDGPLSYPSATPGGAPWEPKNYDGTFEGPMPLRRALQKSKNSVTIRMLDAIGVPYAQQWVGNFGFAADKHPAYLPMALGAGSVTPMQMATAYAVFANGGMRVAPLLVTRIADHRGQVLFEAPAPAMDETQRAIPARNAYVVSNLLQSVVRGGSGSRAYQVLKRNDLYGKTGTTNDSIDTWFAGFQPSRVAVVWMGYDTPRKLGDRETGGSVSLPVWIDYMQAALKGVPVAELKAPPGVMMAEGELYYDDVGPGRAVASLGVELEPIVPTPVPGAEAFGGSPPAEAYAVPPAGNEPSPSAPSRNRFFDFFRSRD